MLSRLPLLGALVLSSQLAFAGMSNVKIDCKSQSGRTVVTAWVPGDFPESMVQISVDGKVQTYLDQGMITSLEMKNENASEKFPNFQKSVITTDLVDETVLIDAASDGSEKFDEIFFTFKSAGKLNPLKSTNGTRYKFNAILNGLDPRKADGSILPQIALSCIYNYTVE